jgi:hypothetical protein
MSLQAIAEGSRRKRLDGVAIDAVALGDALSMSGHQLEELVISRADLTDVNAMVMVGAHLRQSAVEVLRLVSVHLTDPAAVALLRELIESSVFAAIPGQGVQNQESPRVPIVSILSREIVECPVQV